MTDLSFHTTLQVRDTLDKECTHVNHKNGEEFFLHPVVGWCKVCPLNQGCEQMKRLFHVSDTYLGESVKLTPKVPETISKGFNEDAETRRVCVSPTVGQCLMGKSGVKTVASALEDIMQPRCFVYEVITNLAVPATNVHDVWLTDEHWLLEEVEFTLIGEIQEGTCEEVFNSINW